MSDRTSSQQRPVEELARYLTEVTGEPVDEPLLTRALTHRSYSYEHGGLPHNERLEFLGDSVLGLVVTDHLHATHPDLSEGELAKLRAAVVNMRALADVARTIGLGDFVALGRGEETTGGRDKSSILADTVEAVIGAVYLSTPKPQGLEAATVLVHSLIGPLMESSARLGAALDWKTSLQEVAAAQGLGSVNYRTSDEGPDHDKTFSAEALIGEIVRGRGTGRTKKVAEQEAAADAYRALTADQAAS
ncbi:ribonuclease III [Janibacter anophelis]|uniref:ribonuclease III n=1 Tax=Janibacter anophelis TaxID=319054 RepID=UPI000DEEC530|nr:ribonuclease III [Janibacter anophelis]